MTSGGKGLISEMTGLICYYMNGEISALALPSGEIIYADGAWKNNWRARTLTVSACEYIVTTNRPSGDLSNPFCTWIYTDKLIDEGEIDNEGALAVLEEEAAASGGYLAVDTAPHFINETYSPASREGSVFVLPSGIQTVEAEAFEGSGVEYLIVPGSCTKIDEGAFRNCRQLKEVWLPKDCLVDPSAFDGCSALEAVYTPEGGAAEAFALSLS